MTLPSFRSALRGAAASLAICAALAVAPAPAQDDGPTVIIETPRLVIDTDAGTLRFTWLGTALPAPQVSVRQQGDVTVFTFAGDLVIPDGTVVTGTGTRAASLRATNNAIIGQNVTFGVSAQGQTAGMGGGVGGQAGPREVRAGQGLRARSTQA